MSIKQGNLGKKISMPNQNVLVYEVPADTVSTVTISIVNTGNSSATINLYISDSTSPTTVDAIEHGAVVTPGGVLQHTCMPMGAGEKLYIRSNSGEVVTRVAGFEAAKSV